MTSGISSQGRSELEGVGPTKQYCGDNVVLEVLKSAVFITAWWCAAICAQLRPEGRASSAQRVDPSSRGSGGSKA